MSVAPQYRLIVDYRERTSALKISAERAGELFSSLPEFSSENKYLIRRGGISGNLADTIMSGEKKIPRLIKELVQELDNELEELDKFLQKTNIMSIELFKNLQKRIISHQHKQNNILKALYNMGIDFFNGVDGQLRARLDVEEQSYHQFREHVHSTLEYLTYGEGDKAALAETWTDALEYLYLFRKDEQELGLSRETFVHFIHTDSHPFPKIILSKYFNPNLTGDPRYMDKLRKVGFRRPAMKSEGEKKKYIDLSAEDQKKVDSIIKDSLLNLLNGCVDPFYPQHNTHQAYIWDAGDNATKDQKKFSFKHIIEEIYKSKDGDKLTDEYKELVEKLKERLLKEIFVESKRKLKQFSSMGAVSVDNIIFPKQDGTTVTWKDLFESDKDKNGLYNEDKFDEFSRVIVFIQTMLDDSKKHSNKGSLFNQFLNSNSDLFVEEGGNGENNDKNKLWEREKLREYFISKGSIFDELREVKDLIERDHIENKTALISDVSNGHKKLKSILEDLLEISTSTTSLDAESKEFFFRNIIQIKTSVNRSDTDKLLNELFYLYNDIFTDSIFNKGFLIRKIETILNLAGSD